MRSQYNDEEEKGEDDEDKHGDMDDIVEPTCNSATLKW